MFFTETEPKETLNTPGRSLALMVGEELQSSLLRNDRRLQVKPAYLFAHH